VNKGNLIFAVIAGTLMMFGYIICATVINSLVRDYTPKDKEGVFQGVRMVFQVALPMVTGPYIAQVIVNNLSNETYINDFNVTQKLPPKWIWLFGAGVFTLIFIPIIILIIKNHKIHKLDNKGLLYDQTKED
jgi:MFS family permease